MINSLLLWQKFSILGLMALLLMSLPLTLFLLESRKAIEVAREELAGIPATKAVDQLLEVLHEQRSLAGRMASGEKVTGWALASLAAAIKNAEREFDIIKHEKVSARWKTTRSQIAELAKQTDVDIIYGAHFEIIDNLYKINEYMVQQH